MLLQLARLLALAAALIFCFKSQAIGACLDVRQSGSYSFEGFLTFKIFPGSPNFESVERGDNPEPTYILHLDEPICVVGEEDFLDPSVRIADIHVYPDSPEPTGRGLSADLKRLVNRRVLVTGEKPFAAHTGHHHAPLVLAINSIMGAPGYGREEWGDAKTTVEAFYYALAAGSGDEAARFVIPEKRRSGPLSANAISGFYGNLIEPLHLIEVTKLGRNEYLARYTFVSAANGRCNGTAIVRTVRIGDANLISSIRALNGC
jgi:hypothetical protein